MVAGQRHGGTARAPSDPRANLVRTVSALSRLGLIDLRGAASVRLPNMSADRPPNPIRLVPQPWLT